MLYTQKQYTKLFSRGKYETRDYLYYIPYAGGPLRRVRKPFSGPAYEPETVMNARKLAAIRAALERAKCHP